MIERKRVKKLYERSESIVAFVFGFHKQDELKTAPEKRGTSFNRVRALAST
jgi:hypothetical protein